jgi:hypothetical protein
MVMHTINTQIFFIQNSLIKTNEGKPGNAGLMPLTFYLLTQWRPAPPGRKGRRRMRITQLLLLSLSFFILPQSLKHIFAGNPAYGIRYFQDKYYFPYPHVVEILLYSQWGLIPRPLGRLNISNAYKKMVVDPTVK